MPEVTVIDYGMGNLLSVIRAFEHCGATVQVTASAEDIASAKRLVLPGVGAFADGMAELRSRGLIEAIVKYAAANRPFLGICLGMQMMVEQGEEFGTHAGLKLIPGKVVEIERTKIDGTPHKIPHIGWNELKLPSEKHSWSGTIMERVIPGSSAYFVHSFTARPASDQYRLADCLYNGRVIAAVIRSGNLYGTQFHPEKSAEVGLKILKNFLRIE